MFRMQELCNGTLVCRIGSNGPLARASVIREEAITLSYRDPRSGREWLAGVRDGR
jgi:hypothetical protein